MLRHCQRVKEESDGSDLSKKALSSTKPPLEEGYGE